MPEGMVEPSHVYTGFISYRPNDLINTVHWQIISGNVDEPGDGKTSRILRFDGNKLKNRRVCLSFLLKNVIFY
jgi:hypothetical protein